MINSEIQPYKIIEAKLETSDVITIKSQVLDENNTNKLNEPYNFMPGQFSMVYLFGKGEVPISISSDLKSNINYISHTIKKRGEITAATLELKLGDVIGVRGPYGKSWPLEKANKKNIILFAGGVGLAPLRAIIYQIISNRAAYKDVWLFYGSRTPDDILYKDEMAFYLKHNINVKISVDSEISTTFEAKDFDLSWSLGSIISVLEGMKDFPEDTISMICGPEIMMNFVVLSLLNKKVNSSNIYLSLEKNMQCGKGTCGHCVWGPYYMCKDGPVFNYEQIKHLLKIREL